MNAIEAAALLGVKPCTVLRQLRLGRMEHTRTGWKYDVTPEAVERYRREVQALTPLAVRFWAKVDTSAGPDGCWLWTAAQTHGYGRMWVGGHPRYRPTTHVALQLAGRPVPPGLNACHHCDNPPCVNPAHLFIGTDKDNGQDMAAKGRAGPQNRPPIFGEQHKSSKLSDQKVRDIRQTVAAGGSQADQARRYGISQSLVSAVVRRKTWRHLP